MVSVSDINQLGRDAQTVSSSSYAPLENGSHIQLFPDLPHVSVLSFEEKGGGPSRHVKAFDLRQHIFLAQGTGEASTTARFTITIPHYVNLVTLKLSGNWFITPAGNGEDVVMIDLDEQCRFTGPTTATCEGTGTISSGTGKYENATGTVSIKVDVNLALRTAKGIFDGTLSVPSGN